MEREASMTDTLSAARALEEARAARAHVAARAACPPHMHVLVALLMAAMVASQSLASPLNLFALAPSLCAVAALIVHQRKRYGFFVNGYRRGRTLWVAIPLLVFVEAVLFGGIWLKDSWHLVWAPLAGGVLVFPATLFASYRWQAVYKADMAQPAG
jgi:hypothetical protein